MGLQEDRDMLDGLAERLGLEDNERDQFITSSMKRLGYRPRMDWDEPEPENNGGGNDGGDFFSRRQQRQSRDVGRSGGRDRGGNGGRASGGYDY